MFNVHLIIKDLQQKSGTKEKLAILEANKDNEALKEYLRLCTDPSINFYISSKTFPKSWKDSLTKSEYTLADFCHIAKQLSERIITGNAAKEYIQKNLCLMGKEDQELLKYMLLKDTKTKVGVTLLNKVWPDLIEEVGYCRCSLSKDVDLASWPWEAGVYSQMKMDGVYARLTSEGFQTRNGSRFPRGVLGVAEELSEHVGWMELQGELVVFERGKDGNLVLLDRKTGNGLLNSALQGTNIGEEYSIWYYVWDYVDVKNKDSRPYKERLSFLIEFLAQMKGSRIPIKLVETSVVYSLEEALKHSQTLMSLGNEGTIIKHPDFIWKNGTSKEQVKLKLECDVDLRAMALVDGDANGKHADTFGSIRFVSCDGMLVVDVSGFTDEERQEIYDNWTNKYFEKVATVTANDLIKRRDSEVFSLFLPRFSEWRFDKNEADSLERIQSVFDSAKGLK